MFIIEKCSRNDVNAASAANEQHMWKSAWSNNKSLISDVGIDTAIDQFYQLTKRVRTAPYRLRSMPDGTILAALNTNDAITFQKYTINAVGFSDANRDVDTPIESVGAVVHNSGGFVVGSARFKDQHVESIVSQLAKRLSALIVSHRVVERFNSDGKSGGAWLETSPIDCVMANAEVGISYRLSDKKFNLIVTNKFLESSEHGNHKCPFTNLQDHHSQHDEMDEAISALKTIVRQASAEELKLLTA